MAPRILFYVLLLTVARAATSQHSGSGDSNATLTFVEEPRDVVVARNRSALLDCSVRSGGQAEATGQADQFHVTWFQDGQPILVPDPRRDVLPNGSLFFKQVLHKRFGRNTSDEGFYHCLARNSIGALVSRNASVRVAVLSREFTTTPADLSTEVSDVARFWCQIESVPEAVITWEKDGQPLDAVATDDLEEDSPSASSSSRFVMLRSGALHIHNVQIDDAGNYRCVARNQLAGKERRSSAGRLLVIPRSERSRGPQFISPPMSPSSLLWTSQGSNLTLECLATGNPTPLVTRWTFNGTHELVPSAKVVIRPGFLLLSDVDASMSGDYTCTAIDGANVSVSQTTTVEVTTQPFLLKMPKSQVFPTAKTVRFECEVGGHPAPDVRWLKDGRVLPIIGRIKKRLRNGGSVSELVLSNTVTADSGIYQCVAENIAGYASASARLLVNVTEGRPEPPSNLQAETVSPTEILLTWDAPRNVPVDDIKAYSIHCTPVEGGEELQIVSLIASYRVENLKRNTNYTFYVRAYTHKSASDQSERITCSTGDGAPLSAAPNVTLVPLSPTTLKVVWRKFPNEANRPVSLYKIQYRRHRAREFDIEVVKGDVLEYTITGLHPGKKYDVRVLPGSLNMDGQWFTKEMPRVGDPNQLAAPSLQLLSTNSTSITVMWEAPANSRKQADSYKLMYQKQGGKTHGPLTIMAAEPKLFVIGNLSANTAYEVHLWSHADDKDGPASVRTIRTLFEADAELDTNAAFDDPVQLEAEVLSWNSVKMLWQLPPAATSGASNVAFYTVRYVIVPEISKSGAGIQDPSGLPVPLPLPVPPGSKTSRESTVGYLRSTSNEVELKNLSAFTTYQLSVRYHDANGRHSIFSQGINVQTLTHIPSTPQNVSCRAQAGAVVELKWDPPLEPNGLIVGYTIYVSQNQSLDIESWSKQEELGPRLRAEVRGLLPNTFYYIRMQARTSAGAGPLTSTLTVITIPQNADEGNPAKGATHSTNMHDVMQDQHMGVVIGLAIGLGFALVCTLFLLWRSRNCIKNSSPERRDTHSSILASGQLSQLRNGGAAVSHVNGNGFHKPNAAAKKKFSRSRNNSENQSATHGSMVEMEAFVPMLSTIPVDVTSHLDTKGGYPTVSRFNRRSSLSNGLAHRSSNETVDGERNHVPLLEQSTSQEPPMDRRYCFSSGPSLEESQAIAAQNTTTTTVLSQATDDTCLSLSLNCGALDSGGTRSHSHDSSLQSLGASSEDHLSHSRSSRSLEDNDTGICNVDQSVDRWEETTPTTPIAEVGRSDSGPAVVSFAGCLSTTTPIRESGELVM